MGRKYFFPLVNEALKGFNMEDLLVDTAVLCTYWGE